MRAALEVRKLLELLFCEELGFPMGLLVAELGLFRFTSAAPRANIPEACQKSCLSGRRLANSRETVMREDKALDELEEEVSAAQKVPLSSAISIQAGKAHPSADAFAEE